MSKQFFQGALLAVAGGRAAVTGRDKGMFAYDSRTQDTVGKLVTGRTFGDVALSPDGSRAFVVQTTPGNPSSVQIVSFPTTGGPVVSIDPGQAFQLLDLGAGNGVTRLLAAGGRLLALVVRGGRSELIEWNLSDPLNPRQLTSGVKLGGLASHMALNSQHIVLVVGREIWRIPRSNILAGPLKTPIPTVVVVSGSSTSVLVATETQAIITSVSVGSTKRIVALDFATSSTAIDSKPRSNNGRAAVVVGDRLFAAFGGDQVEPLPIIGVYRITADDLVFERSFETGAYQQDLELGPDGRIYGADPVEGLKVFTQAGEIVAPGEPEPAPGPTPTPVPIDLGLIGTIELGPADVTGRRAVVSGAFVPKGA